MHTNNLFGALEFSETAVQAGVQRIVGCSLAIRFAEADPLRLIKLSSKARPAGEEAALLAVLERCAPVISSAFGQGSPVAGASLTGARHAPIRR